MLSVFESLNLPSILKFSWMLFTSSEILFDSVGIEEQPKDRNNTDKRIGHVEKKILRLLIDSIIGKGLNK